MRSDLPLDEQKEVEDARKDEHALVTQDTVHNLVGHPVRVHDGQQQGKPGRENTSQLDQRPHTDFCLRMLILHICILLHLFWKPIYIFLCLYLVYLIKTQTSTKSYYWCI